MNLFDKLRGQKLLSFTLILFTLAIGIVIGTLVNSGAKAAKDNTAAPGATPLAIPKPVPLQTLSRPSPSRSNLRGQYLHHLSAQGPHAQPPPRRSPTAAG